MKYRNMRMRKKIILSIYLTLLPVLLIGIVAVYIWNYKNIQRETASLYERDTQTICDNIDYMQQDVLDISDYFAVNAEVHQILTNKKEKYEDSGLFWTENAPLSFVSDILAIKNQIKTLILYPENGLTPYYISRDASVHDLEIGHLRQLPVYEEMLQARGDIVWKRISSGNNANYLSNKSDKMVAYRMLFDMSKKNILGVLAIGVEVSRYEKIAASVIKNKNEGVVILNSQGQELICAGEVDQTSLRLLHQLSEEELTGNAERISMGKYYVFSGTNHTNNLLVCYISPKSNWGIHMRGDLLMPLTMFFLLFVMTWPLSAVISGNLSKSTQLLLESMEKFESGDFSERVSIDSQDEIGDLARAFNHMAAETQSLIDRNYVMALREREIELNVLQAQINPHFLYNVLDSLYWEAVDSDNEKLGEDILALSELFRLLLSQGQSEITVGKEIELVTRYLQIQRMRFSRRFSYKIDVEEEILPYKISKLLLQPFVENAIVHGFELKQENGYVHITGRRREDRVEFFIEDDGVGMDQEKADQLLDANFQDHSANLRIGHYAVRNIKERLGLRYGENNYELKITSKKGEGTKVHIVIPIVR